MNELKKTKQQTHSSWLRCGLCLLFAGSLAGSAFADPPPRKNVKPEATTNTVVKRSDRWKALAARWDSTKAAMTEPAENLTIPIEYHPDGRVKARLKAERSQIFDEGNTIYAEGIRVELLDPDGKVDGELVAGGVLFDRRTKSGFCKGAVIVKKGGDQIKGVGLYFSSEDEYIKILSDCEIRTHRFKGTFSRL